MQCTCQDIFSTVQNRFWIQFWCLLVFLIVFCFTSPTSTKKALWGLFSSRETTKKSHWGGTRCIESVGHEGHAIFRQKLLNTQQSVGRCTYKSPITKWANTLKESPKKKFTEAKCSFSQCRQLVHWSRFLGHSPSEGSLYYKGPAC